MFFFPSRAANHMPTTDWVKDDGWILNVKNLVKQTKKKTHRLVHLLLDEDFLEARVDEVSHWIYFIRESRVLLDYCDWFDSMVYHPRFNF